MKGSADNRWDSMFKPPAASVAAQVPQRRDDVSGEPEDLGPCAARPMPNGWTGLIVHNGRENTRAFQYVHLGYEEFGTDGQWFVFDFNISTSERWRLRVHGRRLWPIFVNIHHQKLEWIKKAERDFGDDDRPVITAIVIEPVAEPER